MPWESTPEGEIQDAQTGTYIMATVDVGSPTTDEDRGGVRAGIAMMEAMYQAEELRIQDEELSSLRRSDESLGVHSTEANYDRTTTEALANRAETDASSIPAMPSGLSGLPRTEVQDQSETLEPSAGTAQLNLTDDEANELIELSSTGSDEPAVPLGHARQQW